MINLDISFIFQLVNFLLLMLVLNLFLLNQSGKFLQKEVSKSVVQN